MFRMTTLMRAAAEPVIKVAQKGAVVTLTINRPDQLNALNADVVNALVDELLKYDTDPSCSAFIITGAGRAFIAGADIKMMQDKTFVDYLQHNDFGRLPLINNVSKPIIAAVNGFCLGGGCELAMMCDILIASEKAKFGQPEISLGTVPGFGGTQRLPRAIGKSKAMEWILTGDIYSAAEADKAGLVTRVVKPEELMPTAMKIAETIAKRSQLTVRMAKMAVNAAENMPLHQGLEYERFLFIGTFATKDRKEGMSAFVEKRDAKFTNE